MKKFRNRLMIFACIVIVGQCMVVDYSDLSWTENAGSYLGIVSMLLLIVSMVLSNQHEKKNTHK
ncbi:hypothetical protein [Carboxylicivirga sp. N1Y90]|uniref:hypothetical protein n=1 Tax=Carboxylicivirga fragile TaxID=3417571 RepID=UPI003D3500FD|nr:hypothetical protein [Marinilabiliaceae bacterium N1Y90]